MDNPDSAKSIPEMLGHSRIPLEREAPYSIESYQAQYLLTREEAQEVVDGYRTHPAINRALTLRFTEDSEYRNRILGEVRGMPQEAIETEVEAS